MAMIMSPLTEKSSTARQVVAWLVGRADVLFLAYRCVEFVGEVYGPIERTAAALEAFMPEEQELAPENDQRIVELHPARRRLQFLIAENLNNGGASLSPPHSISQRETTQITQPASATNSPLASPGLTNTNFNLSSPGPTTLDPNWQASKPSVRERNAAMFNNELISDVKFIVGTPGHTKTIPAHKYVLSTGSSVFYAMFHGGLAEMSEEILVPDVDPSAFLILLKYLYCDEIQLEADTILATLYAAKKYIVPHLAKACVNYLETSLTAKNACMLLSQSRLFEEPDLMQRCWEVIDAQVRLDDELQGLDLEDRSSPQNQD